MTTSKTKQVKIIPSQRYLDMVAKVRTVDKRAANWLLTQKALELVGDTATNDYDDCSGYYNCPLRLIAAIVWIDTTQGHDYWRDIHTKLIAKGE